MKISKSISFALAALLLFAAAPVFADYASGFPPEHYGGMYLDKDGSVVTLIVEKYKHLYDNYPPEVKIRFVKFSLEELKAVMEELGTFSNAHPDLHLNTGATLDERDNCVYVGMLDPSDENIAEFKRLVSDSPVIRFYQRGFDVEDPLPHDDEGDDLEEATPDSALE